MKDSCLVLRNQQFGYLTDVLLTYFKAYIINFNVTDWSAYAS